MSRKFAREATMKAIYAALVGNDNPEAMMADIYEDTTLSEKDDEYISSVLRGVWENEDYIDEAIGKLANRWALDRIPKIDLALLKIGIYEMKWCDDIPYKVTINECVELAKNFSTEKSGSYVNGVLAGYMKTLDSTPEEKKQTDECDNH